LNRTILTRDEFLTVRLAVLPDPVTLVKAYLIDISVCEEPFPAAAASATAEAACEAVKGLEPARYRRLAAIVSRAAS
jgi:hypothetical protein